MRLGRTLIVIAVLGFTVHWWKNHEAQSAIVVEKSPNGFQSIIMPNGTRPDFVVILAPIHCTSDAAQRADALSERLTELGIPNVRSSSYSSNIKNPTEEQKAAMKRSIAVLNGEIPAVFLHGMGKANPTAQEVVDEYWETK